MIDESDYFREGFFKHFQNTQNEGFNFENEDCDKQLYCKHVKT